MLDRYERIAALYDLLDLPFEYRRYRKIRPLLFVGVSGLILGEQEEVQLGRVRARACARYGVLVVGEEMKGLVNCNFLPGSARRLRRNGWLVARAYFWRPDRQ